jgi:hypothetical protein
LGVKKAKISLQSPKMEFETQKQYEARKNILLGVEKLKISLQSPKTEFRLQNKYGRVTYPSIGNFTISKKRYTLRGQKGKNKPSEPKNDPNGE